jgi:hypothetical protein
MNGPIVIKPDWEFRIGGEQIRCGRTCACECEKKCGHEGACEKKTSKTCVDTVMKKEEVKKFEEDWKNLWKPKDTTIKAQSDKFFVWET